MEVPTLDRKWEAAALADYNFSGVADGATKEFQRQAEVCIQGTMQIALACDARASTHTGFFLAGATALAVSAASYARAPAANLPLAYGGAAAAALLLLAAASCSIAARSVYFHVAGYQPKFLAVTASNELFMLRCVAEDLQRRIDFNVAALARQARWFGNGQIAALASLPFGAAVYFASRFAGV